MKKLDKILLSTTALLGLTTLLSACGKSNNNESSSDNGNTVSMYLPGEKPKNYSALIKSVNKEIGKDYPGVKLSMKFIGWGDYEKKLNVMVTSGDDYDLALAKNFTTNVEKGAYQDMTPLIHKYAEKSYKMVDPAYWKGVSYKGKIYGFPVNANVFASDGITFDKGLLDKYHIDPGKISSYADAYPALKKFHDENSNIAAFAIQQGWRARSRTLEQPLGNNLPFAIDAEGKSNKVVNFYDTKEMRSTFRELHKWYKEGIIPKDAATSTNPYNLQDHTWFARQETRGPFDYGNNALDTAAGRKVVSYPITKPFKTQAQAQVAIWSMSKTSKHKKAAMEVLNELNSNKKVLNTIVWGVQGQQWNFTNEKEGKIKTTSKYDQQSHLGAWMMGNNAILYTQNSITNKQIEARKESIKNTPDSKALGFMPNTDSVKTQLTNCQNVMSKYLDIINTGTADPDTTIPKMDKELKTAGYDQVRDVLQKQYNQFLAKQK